MKATRDIKSMNETGSAVASRRRSKAAKKPAAPAGDFTLSSQDARLLLAALTSLKQGDAAVRLPMEWTGLQGKLAETFNEVVYLNGNEIVRSNMPAGAITNTTYASTAISGPKRNGRSISRHSAMSGSISCAPRNNISVVR